MTHHWLYRNEVQSAGASVSGAGGGVRQSPAKVLDPYYVRSFFDDADDLALRCAAAAIADIQRERRSKPSGA
jgi:hypothetical protein